MNSEDTGQPDLIDELTSELIDCVRYLHETERELAALKKERYQLICRLSQLGLSLRQIAAPASLGPTHIRNILQNPPDK